jgi:hypothetical protein
MATKSIAGGTVHTMPADLKKAIMADKRVLALWEDITPLARRVDMLGYLRQEGRDTRYSH